MRQTIYIPSHGYVTKDDEFQYVGNGILGDAFEAVKGLVTSKIVKDAVVEGSKSLANTLGKKGGEKLADKIIDKAFTKKVDKVTEQMAKLEVKDSKVNGSKKSKTSNKNLLAQIYGNGLFRQTGKGLRRL